MKFRKYFTLVFDILVIITRLCATISALSEDDKARACSKLIGLFVVDINPTGHKLSADESVRKKDGASCFFIMEKMSFEMFSCLIKTLGDHLHTVREISENFRNVGSHTS